MTEKKEKILENALVLFAKIGYDRISTNKIAKAAGVSEGLIFRHFKNKYGLLKAVFEWKSECFKPLMESIGAEDDPYQKLHRMLDLPFFLKEEDPHFWRLIMVLKFQNEEAHKAFTEANFVQLFSDEVTQCFEALEYEDAALEARLFLLIFEGLGLRMLQHPEEDHTSLLEKIKLKYS